MEQLRQTWSRSKAYRVVLVVAIVYTVARVALQGLLLAGTLLPEQGNAITIPNDLQDYLSAADRLLNHRDLYPSGKLEHVEFYQYAPSYALAFTVFLGWSPAALVLFHTLLHIVAYGLLYVTWGRIFRRLNLDRARETLTRVLPIWLIFSAFWSDLAYLNIYIIMALLATLLIDAVLSERLAWSVLWLSIILQTKPQWAFVVLVPFILGRYRFFLKLLVLAVVAYAAIVGVTLAVAGPAYGWQQYSDYVRFLSNLSSNFPWRGPDAGFLGYNHSIMQIVVYLLGVTPDNLRLAVIIKVVLLIPLVVASMRHLRRPARLTSREAPRLSLDLAFALYLASFIWLDMVWELSLGIAVFTYLLSTSAQRRTHRLLWIIFLPYALVDMWQVISYAVFGQDVILPGLYIATDPSIYLPLIMIVILVFYAILLKRLWPVPTVQYHAAHVESGSS